MTNINPRLTKREKRLLREQKTHVEQAPNMGLNLRHVHPLTQKQKDTFTGYDNGHNLMLHGIAGTGKSFLALALALKDILSGISSQKKIVLVRSVVPTRDMGFLPGNSKEKAAVYEAPYVQICNELFGRGDAYGILTAKHVVEFISTSFIRGVTLNDSIVIVDEMQNMSLHELDSIITRMGKNSRIIFCGDFRQSDFTKEQERSGIKEFMRIISRMKSFDFVEFEKQDIVRSALVKEYIIQKDELHISV